MRTPEPVFSVVLPAFEEEAGIDRTLDAVIRVLEGLGAPFEIVVVDDGSRDGTFARVRARAADDPRIRGLRFSRNYGKEAALWAGLALARGRAVITMDSDLQHPPALIPEMVRLWREGAKVVHARKRARPADSAFRRWRARLFNALASWLAGIDLSGASDFKLLDRDVARALAFRFPERRRFYRGLAAWVGYPSATVEFDVPPRADGESHWRLSGLLDLALTAVISFTSAPLRIVTVLGLLTLALAGVLAVDTLWSWAVGRAVSGFATIVMTLLIIGSSVMISLGIIGEYLGRIYEEVKRRPPWLPLEAVGLEPHELLPPVETVGFSPHPAEEEG